jgi:hypothetical protein
MIHWKRAISVLLASLLVLSVMSCNNPTSGTNTSGTNTSGSNNTSSLATLIVINQTGKTIVDIYVSPTSSTRWGSSYLGSSTLSNGGSFSISVSSGYDFNVRGDFSGGTYTTGTVSAIGAGSSKSITLY